jgi:anti-anti-sigma regulatory factor
MFSCTFIPAQGPQKARLQVSGDATIAHIQQFKAALVDALKAHSDLILDGGKMTDADLSCLQLLCAAHRTCQRLSLTPETLTVLAKLLEPSGFARLEGCCLADDKQSCLWISPAP